MDMKSATLLLLISWVGCIWAESPVEIELPAEPPIEDTPEIPLTTTTTTAEMPLFEKVAFPFEPFEPITENPVDTPGTHSIICPKSLRPGSDYVISLSVNKPLSSDFQLQISIVDTSQSSVADLKMAGLNFAGIKVFNLKIPTIISESTYTLKINATGGLDFSYSHELSLNSKQLSIFIQTDKVLYKPGQTVLFRVIAVDSKLRPIVQPIDITVTDNFGNRILQTTQLNNSGVVTNSLELSDQTPLGTWQIKAITQGQTAVKNFEVAEYVLPKFEVLVDLPKYYLININNPSLQRDLVATVSAIYTYGKPVEGSVTVNIKLFESQQLEKNLQLVDGKAQLILSIKELSSILPEGWSINYATFIFTANVNEDATGIVLSGNNRVICTTEKYNLNFLNLSPNNFKPGLLYTAFLQLAQNDGSPPSVQDIKEKDGKFKNITIEQNCYSETDFTVSNVFQATLTESGYFSITFDILQNISRCNLNANFFVTETNSTTTGYKSIETFKTRDHQNIQVVLTNPDGVIKPNVIAHFVVKSNQKFSSFNYYILGKGNIFKSETVNELESYLHNLDIQITEEIALELAPQLKIVVTLLTENNELVADSISVTIMDYFSNKVSLAFNKNSTLPGKEVILNVKAYPNSFIGLLAVDQSVLLLGTGNDITKTMVMDDIELYSQGSNYPILLERRKKRCAFCRFWWPFFPSGEDTSTILDVSGLFLLGDAYVFKRPIFRPFWRHLPMMMNKVGIPDARVLDSPATDSPSDASNDHVRKDFPETFIWTDVIASSNGSYSYKIKVPDTMTSWVASAFATHPTAGLGIGDDTAKLIVLKKFFVSLNLPYSVIRGEEFALQVTIFNYVEFDAQVTITLAKSLEFSVRNCSAINSPPVNKSVYANVLVKKNSAFTVYFWIIPIKTGFIDISIAARTPGSADSMIAKLLVKAEGEPQSYSTSALIQVNGLPNFSTSFNVTLPGTDVLVPNSVYIEITLIGNIMGSSLNGLENLLQMPYGCGEQNMLNFAPDVYIMLYLEFSNQATSDIAVKAKSYMNSGYQKELTYQRRDGSFSAFGDSDSSGSVWLSSFVIKCFHQARNYIPVEEDKIARTLMWIISLQSENGSFSEPPLGRVIHTEMQGGSSSGVALTAYTLISLLENKNVSQNTAASIDKARLYLETNYLQYSTSPYALSIIAYAFFLSNSNKLDDVMNKLNALAITAGGTRHWEETVSVVSNSWNPDYVQTKAVNIETTAYVLLVFSSKGDLSASIPIVKWLITQRNPNGGFASTQDTVVALEALAMFSRILPGMKLGSGLKVVVSNNIGKPDYTFRNITATNSLMLQSYQVPSGTTKVKIYGYGVGTGLIQLNVKYNVLKVGMVNLLSLTVATTLQKSGLLLNICTSWNSSEISGMVVIEINLLTGYSCSYEEQIRNQIGSILKRIDSDSTKLALYLDELTSKTLCFDLLLDKIRVINNVQKTAIRVYRYYDPSTKIIKFYQPTTSSPTNWLTACPKCCANNQRI